MRQEFEGADYGVWGNIVFSFLSPLEKSGGGKEDNAILIFLPEYQVNWCLYFDRAVFVFA